MEAALATLQAMARAEGGRALAVLGDMLELGPGELELHRGVGAAAARAGLDGLYAFGPRSASLAEGARQAGLPAAAITHTEDLEALTAQVRARLAPRDVLLVKASRGMKLERLVEALSQRPAPGTVTP
jgi:UDP-N-acetylmuramoyl-tripeptide--D-alanyl-D-alanine ligase